MQGGAKLCAISSLLDDCMVSVEESPPLWRAASSVTFVFFTGPCDGFSRKPLLHDDDAFAQRKSTESCQ